LLRVIEQTGCRKVNIIAHSRGGLDSRYMISVLGCERYVASLTTISTPHNGSKTMDILMNLPRAVLRPIGIVADLWFRALGDSEPDLYTSCRQFMTSYADEFNARVPDIDGIYYQSFATAMKSAGSDVLEALPHLVVERIDGESDGLVSVASAAHGNFRGVLRSATKRGISHVDAVDLRRRSFTRKSSAEGVADIVDVYVDIVRDLKARGL
jgi:triacylglycerol lipase